MSQQLTMFDVIPREKAQHGATWWNGNWECRNWHGYFQSREGGTGPWMFQIYGFGDTDCSVYTLDEAGKMVLGRVPIDDQNRIAVLGRKYGPSHWAH